MKSLNTVKKVSAIISLSLLVIGLLFSSIYPVMEIDHECTGENCTICYVIQLCESLNKNIGFAVSSIAKSSALSAAIILVLIAASENIFPQSLITQKIKLLN